MLPKINQILHIQINSIDEDESMQEYKARISDMTEEYIEIEVPMNERTGRLKRLFQGDELSIYFLTEGGMKNFFMSTVLGIRDNEFRTVLIRRPAPEAITKIQRRSFLRVPAELDIAASLGEQMRFTGVTDDVSGGGTSFLCEGNIPVKAGDTLSCWLLLGSRNGKPEHIPFKGEIVRIKALETGKQQVMLQFSEISDKDRQKVIRFCFERQLEIRKN
ncbi:flagellar brake protein [Paenibacillus sp. YN15]|uniref:flagellar brake protein n=1 Tax=Paenibacillus sp. YN15 TaxID=1742774 RepID=UPI000DCB99BA|nr:flagellar brake domain-containing protein [Paenibacillus sp. YN15]RAU94745.1 glycosyl transferase [Paenibacillus sp. YN15]